MNYTIKNDEIADFNESEAFEFPKYTSQLINWANQNAQGTRANVVGQMSELFPQFMEECDEITMLREYITDKMNDRKVEKDCLISYAGNKEHYRPLMTRQTFHVKNTMIHGPEIIDYSIVPDDLSQYDSLIGGGFDE